MELYFVVTSVVFRTHSQIVIKLKWARVGYLLQVICCCFITINVDVTAGLFRRYKSRMKWVGEFGAGWLMCRTVNPVAKV